MLLLYLYFNVIFSSDVKMSDKEIQKRIKHMLKQKELGNKYIYDPKYIDGVLQPPQYEKRWF